MMIENLKARLAAFNLQQRQCDPNGVSEWIAQRSAFYDDLLYQLYRHFELDKIDELCLVAVGGYGRQEMFPLSDLDILWLSEKPLAPDVVARLNQLAGLLWDMKLQVGMAIRTLEECIEVGKAEISVATNMLESRFLFGQQVLWTELMQRIRQADFWPLEAFYAAKTAEKAARYQRYHNTGYNLEPDLKHSPGGLRDLHLLSWIMLRAYGVGDLAGLLACGVLYEEEYRELLAAQAVLFRMRFALHLQLKRYDNRLRFDRQLQLSTQLGYQGEGNQAVEAMMRDYFQATQSISVLSQLLLAHFDPPNLPLADEPCAIPGLDSAFILKNNRLELSDPLLFKRDHGAILDLFYLLAQYPDINVRPDVWRRLHLAVNNLDYALCEKAEMRARFVRLFTLPNVVTRAIEPMHRFGVLSAYLPQWKQIEGLMQFDLFHSYTVDEHTVRVMRNLADFADEQGACRYPLAHKLFARFSDQDKAQIYLSALFHDIAKGRNGDHAELGAQDMREFAHLHGFDDAQCDFMAWLVAEHLTMSLTAQRRDIHDSAVVEGFADKVGNERRLAALTCLTVADICATNETLWNDWKATLFQQLHQFTGQQLAEKLNYSQLAAAHRQEALELIKFTLKPDERVCLNAFWQNCPEGYFLRHSAKQLVWHALACVQQPLPVVLVSNAYARGQSELFVHCADRDGLFAQIVQMLTLKKVSIHDAQIMTSENGLVLDSFVISEINGEMLSAERCEQVCQCVLGIFSERRHKGLSKKLPKHTTFQQSSRLRFLENSQAQQTAFELFTLDREGLLWQVSRIFRELGLSLINAKITTIGERAEDFFVVSKSGKALDKACRAHLQQVILRELDGDA